MKKTVTGFSLIELLIVIAIIAILATAAIPQYKNYINKAQVMADLSGIDAYKLGVAICYSLLGTFDGCDAGTNDIQNVGNNVESVKNGLIQVKVTYGGVEKNKKIQFQGSEGEGSMIWAISSDIDDCDQILKGCKPLETAE